MEQPELPVKRIASPAVVVLVRVICFASCTVPRVAAVRQSSRSVFRESPPVDQSVPSQPELSAYSASVDLKSAPFSGAGTGPLYPTRQGFWEFSGGTVNNTAAKEFEAWDLEHGWTSGHREGIDYTDEEMWPPLRNDPSGWDPKILTTPRTYVVSMKERKPRRRNFQKSFQNVGWNLNAFWAAAYDGGPIPTHLWWLVGQDLDKNNDGFGKPGRWGCYLSHLAIMLESHASCPTCDLVIFEDDVVFIPKFQERWEAFIADLPEDWQMLRLGGQSFWEPSFYVKGQVVKSRAVANTWGYIIKATALGEYVKRLSEIPVSGSWGIDAVFQLFADDLPMYSAKVPMILALNNLCSDSSHASPGKTCEEDDTLLQKETTKLHRNWPQGYKHTYCVMKGVLRDPRIRGEKGKFCLTKRYAEEMVCCPYPLMDPPTFDALAK